MLLSIRANKLQFHTLIVIMSKPPCQYTGTNIASKGVKDAVERLHDDTMDADTQELPYILYMTELETVAPIKLFGGIFGNPRAMRMQHIN